MRFIMKLYAIKIVIALGLISAVLNGLSCSSDSTVRLGDLRVERDMAFAQTVDEAC